MRDIIHLLIHLHTIRVSRINIFFPPFDNLTIKRSPAPNHLPQFPRMILTLDPPSPQKITSHYTFNRFRNLRQPQSFHLPSVPPPRSQTTYNEHPRLSKIDSFNSPLRQKLDTAQSKITLSLSSRGRDIQRSRIAIQLRALLSGDKVHGTGDIRARSRPSSTSARRGWSCFTCVTMGGCCTWVMGGGEPLTICSESIVDRASDCYGGVWERWGAWGGYGSRL